MPKTDLKEGSSKHGKALLASVGSNWVMARVLSSPVSMSAEVLR